MNINWLQQSGCPSVVVFYNGWGMDERAILHLTDNRYDVCLVSDYRGLATFDIDLSAYKNIFLVAWSLGVWAAVQSFPTNIFVSKAIAINGTELGVDDTMGIPPALFTKTLQAWGVASRDKFNLRLLGGREQYQQHQDKLSQRSISTQADELSDILSQVKQLPIKKRAWQQIIISQKDLIFPNQNQQAYWQLNEAKQEKVNHVAWPHYPFAQFSSWHEVLTL